MMVTNDFCYGRRTYTDCTVCVTDDAYATGGNRGSDDIVCYKIAASTQIDILMQEIEILFFKSISVLDIVTAIVSKTLLCFSEDVRKKWFGDVILTPKMIRSPTLGALNRWGN